MSLPDRRLARAQVLGNVHIVQEINIAIVFFISGLTLKTDEMMQALRYRFELAYGMIAILFLTGFLGFAFRVIPLVPPEFAIGEYMRSCLGA
jgi:sodium/bile acid cotransporter 7